MTQEERKKLNENDIYLVATWKETHAHVLSHLHGLENPVAKVRAELKTSKTDSLKNFCLKESSFPTRNAFRKVALVMLICNFIVEYDLMNGLLVIVRDIVYKPGFSPSAGDKMPAYVVVEFPKCKMLHGENCFVNQPANIVAVPVVKVICEKNVVR